MYKKAVKKVVKILEASISEKKGKPHLVDDDSGWDVEDLITHLNAIPFEENSVVFIHSGFKSLGKVSGGPQTVIEALRRSLVEARNITVAMPAFTISTTMEKQLKGKEIFDVRHSKTVFKGIPLTFQDSPDLKRSIHPTHSVMAVGPKAEWLVQDHHTCGTSFGAGSPFGKLLEEKSYVMGLGTRLGTVTFYHAMEDIEKDFPVAVYTKDSPIEVRCVDHDGKSIKMLVSAHDSSINPVRIDKANGSAIREIYAGVLEKVANLTYHTVGNAKTWIVDAKEMYEVQRKLTYAGLSIYSSEKTIADYLTDQLFPGQ